MNDAILLKNGRLQVEILSPGTGYTGTRFDHSGIISQVLLDGEHTFCSREWVKGGPGTGGIGLCDGWRWPSAQVYDDTAVGDYFPLPGVGLLQKTDSSPYSFRNNYPFIPFRRETVCSENRITIHTYPILCRQIAIEQFKTITVADNTLSIINTLRNTGERAYGLTEYCHNFMKFDRHPVDSSYRLELSYPFTPVMHYGELSAEGNSFRLKRFDESARVASFDIEGCQGSDAHRFRLENDETGTCVQVEDLFPPHKVFSWNNADAFCMEVFIYLSQKPGEERTFMRKYTFDALSP